VRLRKPTAEEQARRHSISVVFFLIMGISTAIGGPIWAMKQYRFVQNTVSTTAVVTKIEIPNPVNTAYKPTFIFKTQTDHQWEVRAPHASASWNFKIGQEIEIRYDPLNPKDAMPSGWFGIWIGPLLLTIFGFVFTVLAIMDIRSRSIRSSVNTDA